MRFKFLLVVLALFTTQMTFAAPKAAPKTAPAYYGTQTYGGHSSGPHFGVMGPINIIGGTIYWGADVMGLWDLASVPGLSIGGEVGFQFGSVLGSTLWHAPIIATGIYELNISSLHDMKPFVGLGIGVGLNGGGAGSMALSFEMMAHAGMVFKNEMKGLFGRLSLGTANSAFVFMPSVGYFF
jgi:hypothetical protein